MILTDSLTLNIREETLAHTGYRWESDLVTGQRQFLYRPTEALQHTVSQYHVKSTQMSF